MVESSVLITNDAVVMGMLAVILGFVFYTSTCNSRFWKKFYSVVPALLLMYFLPSLLNTFGIIDGGASKLYFVASRYLLPASLVLLIISVDFKKIIGLGPKALVMFFTGTLGIVIGGPIALLIISVISPETLNIGGPNELWRGLTTVAGSWIGGGANQAAMKEVFQVKDQLFSAMVTVDIIAANIWMAVLLFMAGRAKSLDEKIGADTTALDSLRDTVEHYERTSARIPTLTDFMLIIAVGMGATGVAHFLSDQIAPWIATNAPELSKYSLTSGFFWLIVIATTIGLGLSFTRARRLEEAGASKIGSGFLYILVATIGMHMDVTALVEAPRLLLIGLIWISIHAILLLIVSRLIKAPTFYMAVGSQANVGGAASAPVVASAFHPSLAPVGVLLAVFGYAVGTYGAWVCGLIMQAVAT